LRLAIDEDAHSVFPIRSQVTIQDEINLDLTEAIGKLAEKWLLRAINLAYDETLD
jgi:hypothetical protein